MVNQQNNTRKTLYTTSNNSLRFIYANIVLANSGRDFYHAWYYWSNFTRHADNSVSYSGRLGGLKGWPQMDAWLLNHPKYGPTLRDWRANGTVPRKAKWIATIMMTASGILMLFTSAPFWVKVFTDTTMLVVAIWLWLRPEPKLKD